MAPIGLPAALLRPIYSVLYCLADEQQCNFARLWLKTYTLLIQWGREFRQGIGLDGGGKRLNRCSLDTSAFFLRIFVNRSEESEIC